MSHRRVLLMFGIGLLLGGVSTALALWVFGGLLAPLPIHVRTIAFGIVLAVLASRELGILRFPLPQARRLVPRSIFSKDPASSARQFGFEMGTGVRTYMSATAPYVLASALLLLQPGLVAAVSAGGGFGTGRLLTPVLRATSRRGRGWSYEMAASEFRVRVLCMIGATLASGALLV